MGNSIDIADMSRDLDNIKLVTAKMANINNQINHTVNNIKTKTDALQKASGVYLQKLSEKVVKLSSQVNNITKININQSVQTNNIISNIKNTLTNNITVEICLSEPCCCECKDDDGGSCGDGDGGGGDSSDDSWYKTLVKVLKTIAEVIGFFADLISVWEFLSAKFPQIANALRLAVRVFMSLASFCWSGLRVLGRGFQQAMRLVMGLGRFLLPIISTFGRVIFALVAGLSWPVLAILAAIIAIAALFFLYGDKICAYLGNLWNRFTSWLGALWDSLSNSASILYRDFIQSIKGIWGYLSSAGSTLYDDFIKRISEIWAFLSCSDATLYDYFIASILTVWEVFSGAGSIILNAFTACLDFIWESLMNAVTNIFSWGGKAKDVVSDVWSDTKSSVGSAASTVSDKAQDAWSWCKDMADSIGSAFGNASQALGHVDIASVLSVDPAFLTASPANNYVVNSAPNIVIHAQGLNEATIQLIRGTVCSGVKDGEKAMTQSINGGST